MEHFKTVLKESLSLDDSASRCYEIMFLKGRITVGELCGYLNLEIESEYKRIFEILENFVKLGLAKKIPKAGKIVDVYMPLTPFDGLAKNLQKFGEQLDSDITIMQTGLKELRTSTETKMTDSSNTMKKTVEDTLLKIKNDVETNKNNVELNVKKSTDSISALTTATSPEITNSLTTTKSNIGESLSTVIKDLEKFEGSSLTSLQNYNTEQSKGAEDFSANEIKTISAFQTENTSAITDFKKNQETTLTTFSDTSKGGMNSFRDLQTKVAGDWKFETEKQLKIHEETTKTDNGKFTESYTTASNGFNKATQDQLSKIKQTLNDSITAKGALHHENLNKLVKNIMDTLNANSTKIKNDNTSIFTIFNDNLSKQIAENQKALIGAFQTSEQKLGENLTSINNSIKEALKTNIQQLDQKLNQSLAKDLPISIKSHNTELKTNLTTNSEGLKNEVKINLTQLQTQLNGIKDEFSKQIQTEELTITQTFDGIKKTLFDRLNTLSASVEGKFKLFQENLTKQTDGLQTKVNTAVNSMITSTENSTGKFEKQAGDILTQIQKATTDVMTSTFTTLDTKSAENLTSFKKIATENKDLIDKKVQDSLLKLKGSTDEVKTKFEGIIVDAIKNWQIGLDTHQKEWKGDLDHIIAEMSTAASTSSSDLTTKIMQTTTDHLKQFNDFRSSFEKGLIGKITALTTNISEINKNFVSTLGLNITNFDKSIAEVIGKLIVNINQRSNEYSEKVKASITQSQQATTTHKTNLLGVIHTVETGIQKNITTLRTETSSKCEVGKKMFNDLTDKNISTITGTINKVKAEFDTLTAATKKLLVDTLLAVNSLTQDNIYRAKETNLTQLSEISKFMLEKVDSTSNIVINPVQNIKKIAEERKKFLSAIWEDSFKWELIGAEGTWLLFNKASIQNYLRAMIERTKMNCFILVPTLEWIPMDVIRKVKKTQKITVACGPNPNKSLADELVNIGANISVRIITELTMEAIGSERDREEAFYGPVVKKADDMISMVSIQDEFIVLIGDILGAFWRGRSKKYPE